MRKAKADTNQSDIVRDLLTQERLKELLNYNQKTGVFVWKIRKGRQNKGIVAGHTDSEGYVSIGIDTIVYKAHRLAWLYVYGYLPENNIDHKNRVPRNNWIGNLREASKQCNARNSDNPKNNTSGVKGVYWSKLHGKWRARVYINGQHFYLGCFVSFTEAVCHRLAAEQFENWHGCDSASPAFKYVQNNINKKL